jgi:signal transduction histidine kinase
MRPLGPGQWPQPIEAAAALLNGDAFDAQWVSVRGRVTAVARAHDGVMLDLLSDGVPVRAAVPQWPQNWALPGYLRGQAITARGVVGRKPAPPEGGTAKIVLYTPSLEAVEVAPEALTSLFERPREAFNKLFEFEITRDPPLVWIHGQVGFARPGLGFFVIMERRGWVWVQTSAPGKLAPGDFVDAVGWLDMFDERPLLTDAFFRGERPGTLSPRWQRKASEVKAEPYDTHGAAVAVEGRLVEQQRSLTEDSLVLEDQGVVFLARLLHTGSERLPVLERGMRLRLRGTCLAKRMPLLENLPSTFAFQLWLTSPADVEILQRPPWWTVRRVLRLCGVTLLFGVLAAVWVVLLRRQVARQTAVIGGQLEREAVARERTRIARELHDSLGQELVGIALQLDSTAARLPESPQQAERVLDMARMMVRHSQAEAKRSVADLRAEELDSTNLPTALEELVQPLVATTGATQLHLEVQGTPRRLEGIVEHHLLRIGQEAVANAVRHAHAERILVLIGYRDREVVIEVKDNGRGFDANEAVAVASGHFGLLGLRKRANKLQGRLRIDSQPGAGTVVSVTVPLNGNPAS